MCFSPEADVIAGAVIGGVGVDALRSVRHRRQLLLAALPLTFGTHQMIEALAWWGLEGTIPAPIGEAATWVYLAIAFVLPLMVSLAVLQLEPAGRRRERMKPFVFLGAGVTVVLMSELAMGPVQAEVAGRYIAYDADLAFGGLMAALYVAATCIPLLLSSQRRLVVFGVLNLAAVSFLAWLQASGVISLWCAWAAVASIVIVIHVRTSR